jgi:hypothetical protein
MSETKRFPMQADLTDALDRVDKVNQYYILDSLHCAIHNNWATLTGNTEESDVEWFANLISKTIDDRPLDRAGQECQDYYRRIAKVAVESMPRLQERMASRLLCLRDMLKDYQKMQMAKGVIKKAKYI